MIKNIMILCFLAGSITSFSQNIKKDQLDQLFNDFIKFRNIRVADGSENKQEPVKCGFVNVNRVRSHFNEFSFQQQQILKPLLTRPVLQASIVSPSGFFRIHYDTVGINRPNYKKDSDSSLHLSDQVLFNMYLDSVALAADSAYNFEIKYLGFPPPPPDDTAGGDSKYDIYLWSLGSYYGDTQFDSSKGPSYMEVNNNFSANFPTRGIFAVRVTVAHEFHHGIQVGNYIYRDADGWFHELTSTSFEHFVFPSIHDYYYYMPHYFDNPQRSIATNDLNGGDGYDLAIWNIYLQIKFNYNIIKRQWELMPQMRAIESINQSVIENGASFSQVLNEFGIWVYFTNNRAQQGKYFPEAAGYPLMSFPISNSYQFPPYIPINNVSNPVSNNFLNISIQLSARTDNLIAVITNSDYEEAISNSPPTFTYQYLLNNYSTPGTTNLVDKYYSKLTTTGSTWLNTEILNDTWLGSANIFNQNADFPFPSPFNYSYSVIYIPVDPNPTGEFNLNVYSISMKLVFSSALSLIKLDKEKPVIVWNGKDNNNQKLSSGVYIYALKSGNTVKKGKIVIFNE